MPRRARVGWPPLIHGSGHIHLAAPNIDDPCPSISVGDPPQVVLHDWPEDKLPVTHHDQIANGVLLCLVVCLLPVIPEHLGAVGSEPLAGQRLSESHLFLKATDRGPNSLHWNASLSERRKDIRFGQADERDGGAARRRRLRHCDEALAQDRHVCRFSGVTVIQTFWPSSDIPAEGRTTCPVAQRAGRNPDDASGLC